MWVTHILPPPPKMYSVKHINHTEHYQSKGKWQMTVTAIKWLLHPCHVMQLDGKEHVMRIALVGERRNYWIFLS